MEGTGALIRLCTVCGAPAGAQCERCDLPVCAAHAPPSYRRCDECEAEFSRRRPLRVVGYLLALIATSVALVIALFFLVLATGGGALGVAPLILFGSFPIILHRLEMRARVRFLDERRTRPLPAARLVR
ncbi:MAG TPA: hypothetical protein VKZ63_04360 [Kofleriaceae bacterium]|nr:hypothetical protein [Kofleriaceae bacterium]